MKRRATHEDAPAETEIRITWRQWHDGHWEAWVTDNTGYPPHRVGDRAELEWFLTQAYRRQSGSERAKPDLQDD